MMGLSNRGASEPVVRGFSSHRPVKVEASGNTIGDGLAGLVTGSISSSTVISTATPMVTALGVIVVALVIAPLWGMRMLRAIAGIFH